MNTPLRVSRYELRELFEKAERAREKIEPSLNESQSKLFDEFQASMVEANHESNRAFFSLGFSLGMKAILEELDNRR